MISFNLKNLNRYPPESKGQNNQSLFQHVRLYTCQS